MPTEIDARARLERMVAATTAPTLDAGEISDLLALAVRPGPSGVDPDSETEWASGMSLDVGDYVVPPARSGVRYLITASDGAAGATEPTWPVSGASVTLDGVTYEGTTDGAWTPAYDLYFAAAEGWRWKAGKVSDAYDVSEDQQSLDRSQMVKSMLDLAAKYDALAGTSIYGGGVDSSRSLTSAKIEARTGRVVSGRYKRPIFAEYDESGDEDQAIPWIANS